MILSVLFFTAYLGFTPAIFWLWLYFQQHKEKPEPKKFILLLFFLGMLTTVPAGILELGVTKILPFQYTTCLSGGCEITPVNILILIGFTFLIIAPAEEFFKYLVLRKVAFNSKYFDQIVDGIKYGVVVALGFASLENAIYFFNFLAYSQFDQLLGTFILRFFLSSLGHILYNGVMGYYIGLAKFNPLERKKYFRTALFTPIVIHGLFNFLLFTNMGYYVILLAGTVFFILFMKFKDQKNLEVHVSASGSEIPKIIPPVIKKTTEEIEYAKPLKERKEVLEFCPNCFTKNIHKAKYCPECGEKLI